MAYSTLDGLRTNRLNDDLGLTGDGDTSFGSTTARNNALKIALARLWPRMGRLRRESITLTPTSREYTLTTLWDVEAVEQVQATSGVTAKVPGWRLVLDEAADPPTVRILFEAQPASTTTHTFRATGYTPYLSEVAGAASLDLPPRLEWIAVIGARAELWRQKLNQRIDFPQHANANRDTDVTVQELIAGYTLAQREFEEAIVLNQRRFQSGRR